MTSDTGILLVSAVIQTHHALFGTIDSLIQRLRKQGPRIAEQRRLHVPIGRVIR